MLKINEGLKLKTYIIGNYLVERFNRDFNNEKNTFKLKIKEAYKGNGYLIYFENKDIYFDIQLLPFHEEISSKKFLLGTYYFYLLNESTTKNEYYINFLHVLKWLFKYQKQNKDVYLVCPNPIKEINKFINDFNQVNQLV